MTKRGSLDNETTNEFFCETVDDLEQIPSSLVNLGSVAIVLENMEAFIANSKKEWLSMTPTGGDD